MKWLWLTFSAAWTVLALSDLYQGNWQVWALEAAAALLYTLPPFSAFSSERGKQRNG